MKVFMICVILLFANLLLYGQEPIDPPAKEGTEATPEAAPETDTEPDSDEDSDSNWEGDQNLYFGVSFKALGMNVNKVGSGTTLGTMMTNLSPFPLVGYNTESYYFKKSKWGWFFTTCAGTFKIDTQDVGDSTSGTKIEDLGTSIKGTYSHFTPVFFYNWGDKTVRTYDHQGFKIGAGYGASYFSAKGEVMLTEKTPQEIHKIDVSGFGFSGFILMEYRIGPWMFRMSNGGPAFVDGDYAYLLGDMGIDIGYAFAF